MISRSSAEPRRPAALAAVVALLALVGCLPAPEDDGAGAPSDAPVQVARSGAGMVVAAHPLATRAGARMLDRGGNAADAAVAAAFALAVVEPSMSGLGGRTQIILRAADGSLHGIDATTQAPESYDPETAPRASYGYDVVGVPGTVAGLAKLLEDHGNLPLRTVMEPAIRYAEDGFELLPEESDRHRRSADRLDEFAGSRQYFLRDDGTAHGPGELFVQRDMAGTLRTIATVGADAFYRGRIARRIVEDMEAKGGHLTAEALAGYRALEVPVVRGSYRGHDLAGTWVPSYGAITIEILHILETFEMGALEPEVWGPVVAQAIASAYRDRDAQETMEDAERLTSKEWARQRAGDVRVPERARAAVAPGADGAAAGAETGTAAVPDGDGVRVAGVAAAGVGSPGRGVRAMDMATAGAVSAARSASAGFADDRAGHTTHLSAADSSGMVVALTQSLGPALGSKVAAPGLGFLYAATLGGYLGHMEPGERADSHISPFLVLRDGEPFLALGAAGGSRIPSAVVQVVSRVVDGGMTLPAALAAPRVHPDGDTVVAEATRDQGWTPAQVEAMRTLGFPVRAVEEVAEFGRVHAIRYHGDEDEWEGVADPDWQGSASGPGGR